MHRKWSKKTYTKLTVFISDSGNIGNSYFYLCIAILE